VTHRVLRPFIWAALALCCATDAWAQQPDPWERQLTAFDAADKTTPPPAGEVLFVGSSSIEGWDLSRYFPDLKTINRGISGSELDDTVRLADRLVVPYSPRVVVVYAGDNDIAAGEAPEQVATEFEQLVGHLHSKLPQTRIVFIGLKPSILRWEQVERMRAANALIRDYSAHDHLVAYIDVDHAMLGTDEKPRPDLFVSDGLHLNSDGYQLWSSMVRPLLK
jgi:lysophospholipase L1-like esterase